MRIRYRYAFRADNKRVTDFLTKMNISFSSNTGKDPFIVLYAFEDEPFFPDLFAFMEAYGSGTCLWENVFSKEEMDRAEWLRVRSTWRPAYPFPAEDNGYLYDTYNTTNYCSKCGAGLVQEKRFRISKRINWSTRNFFMLNWIHDELFLSPKAQALLSASGFTGFHFLNTHDKVGNVYPEVSQLIVENTTTPGLSPECVDRILVCSECGRTRFMVKPGVMRYSQSSIDGIESDIVKTGEQFGEITCSREILVSQRLYQLLATEKLDRGLVFEPIVLV